MSATTQCAKKLFANFILLEYFCTKLLTAQNNGIRRQHSYPILISPNTFKNFYLGNFYNFLQLLMLSIL